MSVASSIQPQLRRYKNYKNRLRLARDRESNIERYNAVDAVRWCQTGIRMRSTISLSNLWALTCPRALVCRQNSQLAVTRCVSRGSISSMSPTRRPLRQPCVRVYISNASNISWRADSTDTALNTSTSAYTYTASQKVCHFLTDCNFVIHLSILIIFWCKYHFRGKCNAMMMVRHSVFGAYLMEPGELQKVQPHTLLRFARASRRFI